MVNPRCLDVKGSRLVVASGRMVRLFDTGRIREIVREEARQRRQKDELTANIGDESILEQTEPATTLSGGANEPSFVSGSDTVLEELLTKFQEINTNDDWHLFSSSSNIPHKVWAERETTKCCIFAVDV